MTVQQHREAAGLTRTELGAKLRVTEKTVYRWESGAVPDPGRRLRIAALFGVTPSEIDWDGRS